VSAAGWEAAKRLGVQTVKCESCAALMPVQLPERRDRPTPEGREPIRDAYWRVETRLRAWELTSLPSRSHICCSQECARKLAAKMEREHRYAIPRKRFSIHGPYTPSVESS
jgi:hypothetical protein